MRKLTLFTLSVILFFACGDENHVKNSINKCLNTILDSNYNKFKNYQIIQFGRGCIIHVKKPNGIEFNLIGTSRKENYLYKNDEATFSLISYCTNNNIYSFKSIRKNYIISTNNSICSYKELKNNDINFYYRSLEEINENEKEGKYFDKKLAISLIIGKEKSIIDSITNITKVYKYKENVYYYWQLTPTYFDCKDCLIR